MTTHTSEAESDQAWIIAPPDCRTMPTCGAFREPRPWESGGMRYGRVQSMSVSYLTDPTRLTECLPAPFKPADEAIVTVTLQQCEDVDWLAGHSYNLVGVDVSAVFNGQVDRDLRGTFCVVMWEDMCEPIIGGREHSGVPKVFADITATDAPGVSASCSVSRFGHSFLEFSADGLQQLSNVQCAKIERVRAQHVWMNLKHIPSLENDGADVSYVTVYPSSGQCIAAWDGRGEIAFQTATPKQAPTQSGVINLLAALPVLEVRSARVIAWREVRAIDRKPRRLK